MNHLSDEALLALARSGNPEAFGQLVERYQGMARKLAFNMVSDGEAVSELLQEAMLESYLSLEQIRNPERFRSWFFGVVLNLCRNYIRRQKRSSQSTGITDRDAYELLGMQSIPPDPDQVLEERELHQLVLSAVEELPQVQREATLLFYYEHLSIQEIADVCGASVATVKVRLHRARSQLRHGLMQREIDQFVATRPGRLKMIRVKIADILKLNQHTIVFLVDEAQRHILPIWIGDFEGTSIVMGVRGVSTPRPMTFNFIASLLDSLGAELQEVRVETLQGNTFYGIAKIRHGKKVREIDARPSDVLALAVRTGSPIYAAEEVLAKAGKTVQGGIPMPADIEAAESLPLPDGAGMDNILKEVEEMIQQATHCAGEP